MSWTVGSVSAVGGRALGYGFSIVNQNRAPLLYFTYETGAEAEAAHDLMEAVLTGVFDLPRIPIPDVFAIPVTDSFRRPPCS